MINVQIDETTLLNLFIDRLKCWTSDADVLGLYEDCLVELIDSGYFDGTELGIDVFVDNLFVNDTTIMNREMLDYNDIEVDNNEKVLAKNEDKNLYLVRNY